MVKQSAGALERVRPGHRRKTVGDATEVLRAPMQSALESSRWTTGFGWSLKIELKAFRPWTMGGLLKDTIPRWWDTGL